MWRRQPSTFDRSSMLGSRMGVVVSLMGAQPGSCSLRRTLQAFVRRDVVRIFLRAAHCRGRGEAPQQLLQSRLEDPPFGVDIGAELVDPAPHLYLQLAEPEVVRRDELVVPTLELAGDVRDP